MNSCHGQNSAMRAPNMRVRRIMMTQVPKLIYTWKVSMQPIGKRRRLHKRLISTVKLLLIPARLKQVPHVINIYRQNTNITHELKTCTDLMGYPSSRILHISIFHMGNAHIVHDYHSIQTSTTKKLYAQIEDNGKQPLRFNFNFFGFFY